MHQQCKSQMSSPAFRWAWPIICAGPRTTALVVLGLAGLALAIAKPATAGPFAGIAGTVLDQDGQPAAGIKVQCVYRGQYREAALSDAAGRFLLSVARADVRGLTLIAAAPDGSRQAHFSYPWQIDRDSAIQDDAIDEVQLRLAPALHLDVHVVDKIGQPLTDATVGMMAGYCALPTTKTDANGKARIKYPAGIELQAIFAFKAAAGLDYQSYEEPRHNPKPKQAAPQPNETVQLTLDGAQTLRVRLIDRANRPIAGLALYPWLVEKPDQPTELNLGYFLSTFQVLTDQEGVATFDWIPNWNKRPLQIWPTGQEEYVRRRIQCNPAADDRTVTAVLDRVVPVSGHVRFADGRPAPDVEVVANAAGYSADAFRGNATTNAEGRFAFNAWPEETCLFVVNDKLNVAPPIDGIVMRRDTPIDNLEFVLRAATRVHGQVTIGFEGTPVRGQQVFLYQYGKDIRETGQEIEIPDPKNANRSVQPTYVRQQLTDVDGRYEFFVGPGRYDVRGPTQTDIQKFELADEQEREFNFAAARPEKGRLTGVVVSGDPPRPVPNAKISGVYRHQLAGADFVAVTDLNGQFEGVRELHSLVLLVESDDKSLAGFAEITPDETSVTIHLGPYVSANGRLFDGVTKKPLANRTLRYGTRIYLGGADDP